MIIDRYDIQVSDVSVEVVRKDIKNLHIGVYPPNGRVRVSAPLRLSSDAVRLAIISRLDWIRRQQAKFAQQERQSEREMITGESHYFQGKRYRLHVIESNGPQFIRLRNNNMTMELCVRPGAEASKREAILQQWYRERLREQIPELLAKWEPRIGVTGTQVRIKKMKTLWGSCNASAKRIWLNLELAKKPAVCMEYVLVHEMIHFIERHHNDRFRELMDAHIPQWHLYRDELNRAPLAHEKWKY